MPYYSPILPSVYINEAPNGLIAKTKSNQSQGRAGGDIFRGPIFLPDVWVPMEGSVLEA
jgi:hypothetical protein